MPPLAALRAFSAYAETGSLTAAGARLNVTHAAISQQIRALEARLGLSLLERNGRRTSLTPEGRQLARALEQGFGAIAEEIEALTGAGAARPVQVSVTPTFASAWLMPRLADLRARHPEINLMIDASPALRDLRPGEIDVAIRHGTGDWPGFNADLLLPSPIAVVAAPSLVGKDEDVGLEALTRYHWLHETGVNEASQWLARHGVTQEIAGGATALPGNMMLEAVRAGQGIAILAWPFIAEDIAAGRLRLLFHDELDKGYYIVTRPGAQRDTVRKFLRWLRRQKVADDTAEIP